MIDAFYNIIKALLCVQEPCVHFINVLFHGGDGL